MNSTAEAIALKHDFTCEPEMEQTGAVLLAYVHNVRADIIKPILSKHGIDTDNIDPEGWYPSVPVMEVLKELYESPDATANLIALGIKIAEFGVQPEDIIAAPLPVVLEHWHDHMHFNFRNGDPGEIVTEKIGEKSYRTIQRNRFPDDLCYGLAYGFARSRLPMGTNFRVYYEEYDNRIDNGGNSETVICVEWE